MQRNDEPLVSIIMPAYNAGKYILEALDSAFNQSYSKIEIIVVNDGSTDNTSEILDKIKNKLTLIDSAHLGAAHARNLGIEKANGELIAFLDADDTIEVDKIRLQVAEFTSDSTLDLCYTMFHNFICPTASEELKKSRSQDEGSIKGCVCGTTMVKKSSFEKVGYFDTQLKVGEFIKWYSKAMDLGFKIKLIEKDLYYRRSHDNNSSLINRSSFSELTKLLKSRIDNKSKNDKSS